jgi:hypothetical protein
MTTLEAPPSATCVGGIRSEEGEMVSFCDSSDAIVMDCTSEERKGGEEDGGGSGEVSDRFVSGSRVRTVELAGGG